jgi:hypothetical protein
MPQSDDLNLPEWLSFDDVRKAARIICRREICALGSQCGECAPGFRVFELARDVLIVARPIALTKAS